MTIGVTRFGANAALEKQERDRTVRVTVTVTDDSLVPLTRQRGSHDTDLFGLTSRS